MSEKEKLTVEGYRFTSEQDVRLAEDEVKKAKYFHQRTTGQKPRTILAVYDKILDEKIFKTPVGWEYLKYMQEELYKLGIPEEEIRPIPMYSSFAHREEAKSEDTVVKQRIRPSRKKEKANIYKFRVSLLINFLLVILVIAMFTITLKSDNPNILNYKNVIVNQYAAWEQELTEKENELRERERELEVVP